METENKGVGIKELPIEMQEILKHTDFPVSRDDLIEKEKESEAIPDVLRELGMLPDKKYNSAEEVARELHWIYMGVPA